MSSQLDFVAVRNYNRDTMDIRMVWNRRQARCKHCEGIIEVANPMVIGKLFKGIKRRITITWYWHPQCWVDAELAYLNDNPYTPGIRGRRQLDMPQDDQRKRFLLIRRYNTLKYRRKMLGDDHPDNILAVIKLEEKMAVIVEEIKEAGGVPAKWRSQSEITQGI